MSRKKTAEGPGEVAPSFEQALEKIERIVAELEGGQLALSDALARYEEGVTHLKLCHIQLERAQRKIELLSGVDAAGNPITEPLDDRPDSSLVDKAAARGKRRSQFADKDPAPNLSDDNDMDEGPRLF